MSKENVVADKAFDFALNVIELYKKLKSENEFILSKQLLRSSTSVGANIEEATAAQTKKDFITKMSIASKEARESRYWLRLIKESKLTDYQFDVLIDESEQLIKILTAIVKTSQTNINKPSP